MIGQGKKDWDLIDDEVLVFVRRLCWIEKTGKIGLNDSWFAETYNQHVLNLRKSELDGERRYNDLQQWPEGLA